MTTRTDEVTDEKQLHSHSRMRCRLSPSHPLIAPYCTFPLSFQIKARTHFCFVFVFRAVYIFVYSDEHQKQQMWLSNISKLIYFLLFITFRNQAVVQIQSFLCTLMYFLSVSFWTFFFNELVYLLQVESLSRCEGERERRRGWAFAWFHPPPPPPATIWKAVPNSSGLEFVRLTGFPSSQQALTLGMLTPQTDRHTDAFDPRFMLPPPLALLPSPSLTHVFIHPLEK